MIINKKMKKIIYRLHQLTVIFNLYFFKIIFFFCQKDCKDYFLISERGNDARDNGYYFYNFLKKNHPECKVKYIITKDSPDIKKIAKDDIIYYNSPQHYKYLLYSKYLISTHIMGYTPNTSISMKLNKLNLLPTAGKKIFLQHGITKDYTKLFDYSYTKLSLFICAAKKEYDFIKEFNKYPPNKICDIGFCRFDSLDPTALIPNTILIMPTWRHWHSNYSDKQFKTSNFFKEYDALLNSDELISFIEQNNIKIYFYLHHETQRFSHLFKPNCQNIVICQKSDFDVQDLLNKCQMLITDYSSVFFDFAYMKKKIIYFHFDYYKYRQTHHEGYFSYENDGFGKIFYNSKDIIDDLKKYGMGMNSFFKNRVDLFFGKNDNNNCKRTFDEIVHLE